MLYEVSYLGIICSFRIYCAGQIDTGGGEERFQPALRMQNMQSALCLRAG